MKHTGLPLEKIEQSMERDMFMSPVEAQNFGLIDKILTSPPSNKVTNEGSEQQQSGISINESSGEKKWSVYWNI